MKNETKLMVAIVEAIKELHKFYDTELSDNEHVDMAQSLLMSGLCEVLNVDVDENDSYDEKSIEYLYSLINQFDTATSVDTMINNSGQGH